MIPNIPFKPKPRGRTLRPRQPMFHRVFEAELNNVRTVLNDIRKRFTGDVSDDTMGRLELVLAEVMNNVAKHGGTVASARDLPRPPTPSPRAVTSASRAAARSHGDGGMGDVTARDGARDRFGRVPGARTYIVLAHPEPRSFNGAWAGASRAACLARGHEVVLHDLVASGFDPVERAERYGPDSAGEPARPFDPLAAQDRAARRGALPADVALELERVRAADLLILHFPLWWFGPPAVLKGWLDRCLVHGALHTSAERFDTGRCRGKRALLCVSTGSSAAESGPGGKEGEATLLLWPLAHALRYVGFTVLRPHLVHGVHGFHQGGAREALERRLSDVLAAQDALIGGLDEREAMAFNADGDFDAGGVLRPDAPSHSPFVRRR